MKVRLFILIFVLLCCGLPVVGAQESNSPREVAEVILPEVNFDHVEINQALKVLEGKTGLIIVPRPGVEGQATLNVQNIKVMDAIKILLDSNRLAYVIDKGVVRVMSEGDFDKETGHGFSDRWTSLILQPSHTKAIDLVVKLDKFKTSQGKIFLSSDGQQIIVLDTPSAVAAIEEWMSHADVLTETQKFDLHYVNGEDVAARLREELTPDVGEVKFDSAKNQLVVTDTPESLKKAEGIIAEVDQRQDVTLDVKVAKVILSEDYREGIDWAAIVSKYQSFATPPPGAALGSRSLCAGMVSVEDYAVLQEALDTVGAVEFFPGPRFKGRHNQQIDLHLNPQTNVTITLKATLANNVEKGSSSSAGGRIPEFYLTPTVRLDGGLNFKILTSGPGSPSSAEFEFKGDSVIVIGGIFREESINSIKKFPLLGDLPFVGWAFRRQKTDLVKTEYVIFIRSQLESGEK